ncbi:MAG: hypothetical protein LUQ65_12435 [Candidatus Helarchaeota archaeon]|nr:hypothetical protein [Candidatus Helarchaeota archaeon]
MQSLNQGIKNQAEDLLTHAENEEKNNNWNGAIELLRKAEELVLNKDLKEIEGRIYYRLGRNCHLAGDSAKEKESVLKNYQVAIESYQKAKEIYEKLKIKEKISTLSGFINVLTYLFGFGVGKELKLLESAKEFFKHAKLIYQQQGNFEDSVKMEIMETRAFSLFIGELTARFDEKTDYKKIIPEFDELVIDIIEKLRKKPKLSDFYLHRFLVCMGYCFHWIGTYVSKDVLDVKKQLFDYLKRHEEIINIIESNSGYETYFEARFYAYAIFASFSLIMGAYYAETQFAIKDLYKNAGKWHKKAESLLPRVKFNTSLSTFHTLRFSI